MAKKFVALTDADYHTIGRRHGSTNVAKEAADAATRWRRDVTELAPYGHGASALAAFESLREEHQGLRENRPETVAVKTVAVKARNAAIERGWAWVNQVTSFLGVLAREDAELATKLSGAMPANDAELDTKIITLKGLVEANIASLAPEVEAAERVSEADERARAIRESVEAAQSAKRAPVYDTADLDLLDGKLYVTIKELSAAARRAIRDGKLARRASEYRFHYLSSGSSNAGASEDEEKGDES